MADYFECVQCKAVTPVVLSPPKCGKCGSGTGVVVSRDRGQVEKNPAENGRETGGSDFARPDR
jgi:hypothetical protein